MNLLRKLQFLPATLLAAGLAAQVVAPGPQDPRPAPQDPAGQRQGTGAANPAQNPQDPEQSRVGDPDLQNLIPVWQQPPTPRTFQGFPIFPTELPGYGGYPRGLGEVARELSVGARSMVPSAPAPPEHGWPRWLRNESREPLPYEPDLALLVRNVDRVWFKAPEEAAFVPLYFYDKLRPVAKGTEIEVRHAGEFELLLHGGSRVLAQGPTAMTVEELGEAAVALQLGNLTRVRLDAFGREHRIGLPDGSTVIMRPESAAPAADDPAAGGDPAASAFGVTETVKPALLLFERIYEPGWRGGRATIWNGGQVAVEWRHAFGSAEIAPGNRVTFFLSPPSPAVPAALTSEQVTLQPDGAVMRCEAADAGEVCWSGARFRLGKGAVLTLDPLQGNPFAPRKGR